MYIYIIKYKFKYKIINKNFKKFMNLYFTIIITTSIQKNYHFKIQII